MRPVTWVFKTLRVILMFGQAEHALTPHQTHLRCSQTPRSHLWPTYSEFPRMCCFNKHSERLQAAGRRREASGKHSPTSHSARDAGNSACSLYQRQELTCTGAVPPGYCGNRMGKMYYLRRQSWETFIFFFFFTVRVIIFTRACDRLEFQMILLGGRL